jgi:hypothetical protein
MNMKNKYYTVFVSETGKHDHTAFLWIETENVEIYKKAVAAAKERGLKVTKTYFPDEYLNAPNIANAINIK